MSSYADEIRKLARKHHRWRGKCLNMIPAENVTSPAARELMSSDLMHRYAAHEKPFYRGTRFMEDLERLGERLAERLFEAGFACLKPISGNTADMTVLAALTKPGDTVISVHRRHGGYYGFTRGGCAECFGLKLEHLPFDPYEMNVKIEEAAETIRKVKPKLVFFGASFILFPHPVKELREAADEVEANMAYDGSHVLGLIAGKEFQDPLREGAELLIGSTHKTFPGPQGGIILGKKEFKQRIEGACFPMFDNRHMHKIAALAMTLAEMLEFGKQYATQVVKNAKTLARTLDEAGIPVKCAHKGYTKSHQVLLDMKIATKIEDVTRRLEEANIIVDRGIRLGTQELTRLGMREDEMRRVAGFFKRIIVDREKPGSVVVNVREMCSEFDKVRYCFEAAEAYQYHVFP